MSVLFQHKFIIFLFLTLFSLLSFSEYLLSRKTLASTPPPTIITLINPPPTAPAPPQLSWRISSSAFNLISTSIYYSSASTPSALTTLDSPSAVGYAHQTPDYALGSFSLPDTFTASLLQVKSGKVFYRAYAYVNNEHHWTPEFTLKIP